MLERTGNIDIPHDLSGHKSEPDRSSLFSVLRHASPIAAAALIEAVRAVPPLSALPDAKSFISMAAPHSAYRKAHRPISHLPQFIPLIIALQNAMPTQSSALSQGSLPAAQVSRPALSSPRVPPVMHIAPLDSAPRIKNDRQQSPRLPAQ